ncbi:unnamed protein product [Penicillium roqueforti FM164]|uniref:Genomic scaffold, ProqFM164S04 n=1 Tax=Penicillium roqueforti (strain FM164) TaxID=1365484 RepID=W6QI02_PENRF|nr:unnamed protein product [Penicillium roqueforti FM164]
MVFISCAPRWRVTNYFLLGLCNLDPALSLRTYPKVYPASAILRHALAIGHRVGEGICSLTNRQYGTAILEFSWL